jgi:hypothetical protein
MEGIHRASGRGFHVLCGATLPALGYVQQPISSTDLFVQEVFFSGFFFFFFAICFILLLLCWGYIVTFIKVLTIYHS